MFETKSENLEDKMDEKNDTIIRRYNSILDVPSSITGWEIEPQQAFGMQNNFIEKNIEFVGQNKVVFSSGCNLVCYDLKEKSCEFFLRKFPTYIITSISVGYKTSDEPLICVGESSPDYKLAQISVISSKNSKIHYVLNYNRGDDSGWFVKKAIILKNSPYCLGILMKENEDSLSKIMFWKYTHEKFISQVVLFQYIYSVSYNPKNCLELILCGKGYLRLWNVFINDGSIKEHPQRFLKGKQEKEKSFIKAVFFENKSFMFIVVTLENNLYVIEGFKLIFNLNIRFEQEIYDLNIDKILVNTEEDYEGEAINTNQHSLFDEEESDEDNSGKVLNTNYKNTSHKKTEKPNESEIHSSKAFNSVKTFYLIKKKNHYNILLTSTRESITYLYKLEKELKKITMNQTEFNTDECLKFRIAKNIKSIVNVVCNEDSSKIIYMCELENDASNDKRISFYLFERLGNDLKFEREIFKEFFFNDNIRFFDYCEKKRILYTITKNNWLRCFDNNNYSFYTKHNFFNENLRSITSSPNNNLFGISKNNKFTFYALLRDDIAKFCEFDIKNSIAKYSKRGDIIAIAGESKIHSNSYCIYFLDVFHFHTLHVIEHLPFPIKKLMWLENDKYIMIILQNNSIFGWNIDLDYLTVNMYQRIKENEQKSIQNYYFKLFFKHITTNNYIDFDYDTKNDLLLVAHSGMHKLSIFNKHGRKLAANIEIEEIASCLYIIHDLKCLLVGNEKGCIKIYSWPLDSIENEMSFISKHKLEIFLHSSPITNIYLTCNLKQLISAAEDGSIYICKIKVVRGDLSYDFDYFDEVGYAMKLPIEQTIKFCEINEYAYEFIEKKDKIAENLSLQIEALVKSMEKQILSINKQHKAELKILDEQKTEALSEETKKKSFILREIEEMKNSVKEELENKINEHEENKKRSLKKNEEKLKIYENEIERLKTQLKTLKEEIKANFDNLQIEQQDFFKNISEKNLKSYYDLVDKINESIRKLVLNNCYRDEAIETINEDYRNLIEKKKNQYDETIIIDKEEKKKHEEELEKKKKKEENNKFKQEKWILESNKIIQKNIQIKQNLNDTTQKIITLQEQLLETEKNLQKIDRELESLTIKNKHLEQIRFVLENRTTSLEKEKSPLEDQCLFLEKQKNNLQEEFNKLVLQIRLSNQGLENKQSQFKACLMQNFEIDEQIKFLRHKLTHLQVELLAFIDAYRNETKKVKFPIKENKPSQVCLQLRSFYDKYFGTPIEDELANFHYYMQKLQEMSEKANAASNNDLIKRDKATEKLYNEEDKLSQLKIQKEEVFRRMQKENTTLIAECNRLRKNLHEVFMHVVEIEKKFEDLTKINPKLNKTEMVYQIKEFIKQTHNKIKSNYMSDNSEDNKPFSSEVENDGYINNNSENTNILRSIEEHQDKFTLQTKNLDKLKLQVQNIVSDEESRGDYENFLKLPEIKNHSILKEKGMNTSESVKKEDILPKIDGKKYN